MLFLHKSLTCVLTTCVVNFIELPIYLTHTLDLPNYTTKFKRLLGPLGSLSWDRFAESTDHFLFWSKANTHVWTPLFLNEVQNIFWKQCVWGEIAENNLKKYPLPMHKTVQTHPNIFFHGGLVYVMDAFFRHVTQFSERILMFSDLLENFEI